MYDLRRQNIDEPKISQLNTYLATIRKKLHGKSEVSYYDLDVWCSKRSEIPQDIHQVFVIGYVINVDEDDPKKSIFRVSISTRFLLELAFRTTHLAADATYKLNFQGFPAFLIGVNDMQRVFHSTSLSICSGEAADDFAFVFRSVNVMIDKLMIDKLFFMSVPTYSPQILIADGAEGITNGFIAIFVLYIRIMCWAHVIRAVDKRLNVTAPKDYKNEIMVDIYA
jgi:hypothetical protein